MGFTVCTTFNVRTQPFGASCLQSLMSNLPHEIEVIALVEGADAFEVDKFKDRLSILEFQDYAPDFTAFKGWFETEHAWRFGEAKVPFRYDAVRFAHKPFCLNAVIKILDCSSTTLIWLDADTILHHPTPSSLFERMSSLGSICYLGRDHLDVATTKASYSECGLMLFDLQSKAFQNFWDIYFTFYYQNNGLYDLREWHDSFVFDASRRLSKRYFSDAFHDITNQGLHQLEDESNVFVASVFGEYFDHLKGSAKRHKRYSDAYAERHQLIT